MKIHRLDHIHVYYSDFDTSVRFYTGVFEEEMLGKAYDSDGGVGYFPRLGGLAFALALYPPEVGAEYSDCISRRGKSISLGEGGIKNLNPARAATSAAGFFC